MARLLKWQTPFKEIISNPLGCRRLFFESIPKQSVGRRHACIATVTPARICITGTQSYKNYE